MFATDNVISCSSDVSKSSFGLMNSRIGTSFNPILKSIVEGDVYFMSTSHNLCVKRIERSNGLDNALY